MAGVSGMSDLAFNDSDQIFESERAALACELGFLTENQVAVLARIKTSTLREWRKHGNGPTFSRFGNAFFYPKGGVSEFIQSKQNEVSTDWIRI